MTTALDVEMPFHQEHSGTRLSESNRAESAQPEESAAITFGRSSAPRNTVRSDVSIENTLPTFDEARAVLMHAVQSAKSALEELEAIEWQLEEKWKSLAHLTSEVKKLEGQRASALELAKRLSSDDFTNSIRAVPRSTRPSAPRDARARLTK